MWQVMKKKGSIVSFFEIDANDHSSPALDIFLRSCGNLRPALPFPDCFISYKRFLLLSWILCAHVSAWSG